MRPHARHGEAADRPDDWHTDAYFTEVRQQGRQPSQRFDMPIDPASLAVHRPPFQGQGRPPGQTIQEGRVMTEAAVGFAGNLTDDPEVRYTEAGIARAMFRVAVSGRREQEASFFGSGSYLVMDTTCAQTASARVAWQ